MARRTKWDVGDEPERKSDGVNGGHCSGLVMVKSTGSIGDLGKRCKC